MPLHHVEISEFYIGKHEVTLEQFNTFVEDSGYVTTAEKRGYSYVHPGNYGDNDSPLQKRNGVNWQYNGTGKITSFSYAPEEFPVVHVSKADAEAYCHWLTRKTGLQHRLPTEAEWEYACRAGTSTPFAGGGITHLFCKPVDPVLDRMGWFCGNSGYKNPPGGLRPHPVKTKQPNRWGLYDMHGNVQEWCLDSCKWRSLWKGQVGVITDTYRKNIVDPLSKKGKHRVIRGGGWHQSARYCRSAYRSYYKPNAKRNSLGFRIVREY